MAVASPTGNTQKAKNASLRSSKRREWLIGYLFILPAFVIISIFGLFPIGYAIYMSLHRWRIKKGDFIGLENYQNLIGSWWGVLGFIGGILLIMVAHWLWTDAFKGSRRQQLVKLSASFVLLAAGISIALGWGTMMSQAGRDGEVFLKSIVRTFFYALGSIPIQISLALGLAYMLFQKVKGQELFRMLFFLPYITPVVAAAVIFETIFSPREERLANQAIGFFGIEPQRWLNEPSPLLELWFGNQIASFNTWLTSSGVAWQFDGLWLGPSLALVTVIFFGIWTYTGYNTVIFLAGLGNIPSNLYEAAEIDGANGLQQFWHITVPLLSPVTFYLTVLGFIGTLQAFTHLYVMRQPFARDTMDTASVVIFDTFFKRNNISMAATQAIFLFVIILLFTLLQNRFFGRSATGG